MKLRDGLKKTSQKSKLGASLNESKNEEIHSQEEQLAHDYPQIFLSCQKAETKLTNPSEAML